MFLAVAGQEKTVEMTLRVVSCQAHFAVLFKITSLGNADERFKMANLKKKRKLLLVRVDMWMVRPKSQEILH